MQTHRDTPSPLVPARPVVMPSDDVQRLACLFVDGMTGFCSAYVRKMSVDGSIPKLGEAYRKRQLTQEMLRLMYMFHELKDAYLEGRESILGEPLAADGSVELVPRMLLKGDPDVAHSLRQMLRLWPEPLDEAGVLLKLLPELSEGIAPARAQLVAEDILDGHAPLGLMALRQLHHAFIIRREKLVVPTVNALLGAPERVYPPRDPKMPRDG